MRQWGVGDYVVLNGPSGYKGVRGRIVDNFYPTNTVELWYVEIEGKKSTTKKPI